MLHYLVNLHYIVAVISSVYNCCYVIVHACNGSTLELGVSKPAFNINPFRVTPIKVYICDLQSKIANIFGVVPAEDFY